MLSFFSRLTLPAFPQLITDELLRKSYYLQSNGNIQAVWAAFPKKQLVCLEATSRAKQRMSDITKNWHSCEQLNLYSVLKLRHRKTTLIFT